MRVPFRFAAVFVVLTLLPAPAFAWGFVGHRLIMGRAIDLLPPELKPFFVKHRDEIVVRAVDPDTWRVAGWPENAHHFLDFGVPEYGKPPFTELPRDYDAALEKFGRSTLERNGLLPWRLAEFFGQLRRAFEGFGRQSAFATTDVILFSAVDVPLHPGRPSAVPRHRQLRRAADRAARHSRPLRDAICSSGFSRG